MRLPTLDVLSSDASLSSVLTKTGCGSASVVAFSLLSQWPDCHLSFLDSHFIFLDSHLSFLDSHSQILSLMSVQKNLDSQKILIFVDS